MYLILTSQSFFFLHDLSSTFGDFFLYGVNYMTLIIPTIGAGKYKFISECIFETLDPRSGSTYKYSLTSYPFCTLILLEGR